MKKINQVAAVLLIAAAVAAGGCSKDKYNFLTEEELAWMVYAKGQQVKFRNDTGALRSYNVANVYRGYVKDGGANNEHVNAIIQSTTGTGPGSGSAKLEVAKSGSSLVVYGQWPFFSATAYMTSIAPVADTIGGVAFSDVYIFNVLITDSTNNVEQLKYSKSKGFVQYTESNGEVWTLSN